MYMESTNSHLQGLYTFSHLKFQDFSRTSHDHFFQNPRPGSLDFLKFINILTLTDIIKEQNSLHSCKNLLYIPKIRYISVIYSKIRAWKSWKINFSHGKSWKIEILHNI